MRQASGSIDIATAGTGLVEITGAIAGWVRDQGMEQGLITIFCRHSSASLLIQENAAPEVREDILAFFARLAPEGRGLYAHDDEGLDDMPAHLRAALTQVNLSVPIIDGRLALGTWQGIYLFEHRRRPHKRSVALHLMGE